MLDPQKRFVGRKEFFGCLIYDRERGDYIPFDSDALYIFEESLKRSLDDIFNKLDGKVSQQSFDTFIQLCQSIELIDSNGKFVGELLSPPLRENALSAPLRVHIALTYETPITCKHLYDLYGDAATNELTLSEVKQVLQQMAEMGTYEVTLGGGEPLVRGDLFEIIKYARMLGISVNLKTTGTAINRSIAKQLAESDLKAIKIPFGGASEKTYDYITGKGSFRKAVRGIRTLKEFIKSTPIYLSVVLMKPNLMEIPAFVRISEKVKADGLLFTPIRPWGVAIKNQNLLLTPKDIESAVTSISRIKRNSNIRMEILQASFEWDKDISETSPGRFSCPKGTLFCYVSPTGGAAGCGYASRNPKCGNIRGSHLRDLWDGTLWATLTAGSFDVNAVCHACENLL